jgi:FAD/FMN-containing dehydrogenase
MRTSELTGEVVRAGDPGYEAARMGWNRRYSRYPDAIVFCANAHEVATGVASAREHGVALRARGG